VGVHVRASVSTFVLPRSCFHVRVLHASRARRPDWHRPQESA
jgi:hypothetical protein